MLFTEKRVFGSIKGEHGDESDSSQEGENNLSSNRNKSAEQIVASCGMDIVIPSEKGSRIDQDFREPCLSQLPPDAGVSQ
jgi:hypothetical protein